MDDILYELKVDSCRLAVRFCVERFESKVVLEIVKNEVRKIRSSDGTGMQFL